MIEIRHPNVNRAPRAFERMCERALEIDSFLKMKGIRLRRHGASVAITFESETAAQQFELVVKRGMRV